MATDKIITFFSQYKHKQYKRGELLKNFEEKPEGIFCLQKGAVRCYSLSRDGAELTLNIFKPISFFPTNWIVNGKIDNYSYNALTEVGVYIAPRDDVEKFLKENPDVVYDLLKRISRGLEGYYLKMEAVLSGNPYFRTVVQLILFTRRFGIKNGEKYAVHLTHSQLASLIGLTRETVTREIKKLEDKKLVTYEGKKLIVLDKEKLEEELTS